MDITNAKNKMFISFGQCHVHRVNGNTLDCDCVGVINCNSQQEGDEIAFSLFDGKFHEHIFESEKYLTNEVMQYYPRGYIEINPKY